MNNKLFCKSGFTLAMLLVVVAGIIPAKSSLIAQFSGNTTTNSNGIVNNWVNSVSASGDWSALRKAKAAGLPSLIYNSDGNDDFISAGKRLQITTKEEFYKLRTEGLERLPVAIFYCTGTTHLFSHRTKIGEMYGRNQGDGFRAWITDVHEQEWDPLSAIVEWGREHGKPVFYTHRMNDLHEAARAKPIYAIIHGSKWTKENRSLLIRPEKTREASGPINDPSWYWIAMNYAHQEVRDYVYSLIEEIVTGYDVDGVELDFMRFPIFFRTPADGKPATDEELAAMTDLVRSLRGMLDRLGKKREKPLLLAVHVPDSLDYAKEAGLDVRQWLKEDLVDVVVGGGDFQLRPWRELVAECAPFDVPVYACFNRTLVQRPDAWYAHAFDAWQQGVHGIATFNFFEPKSPIIDNIYSKEKLAELPKAESYELDHRGVMQLRGLGSFVRHGHKYFSDEVGKRWINLPSLDWPDSRWENL